MITLINNHYENFLGTKPSKNKSTSNCRNKEACPLNGQYQIGEVVYNQIAKKKSISELRKNLSKDVYTTAIYLSEMNFTKTTQNFL